MSALETAQQLRESYGFNCVPILKFVRFTTPDGEDKKQVAFEKGYDVYRAELYPLERWPNNADYLAIVTGHLSNLTIVDVDSDEARAYIENYTGQDLETLSSYIIKTKKGWQLFYKYDPSLRTTTGLDNLKLDILNDGRQTFAHEINPGYTTLRQGALEALPESLKAFLLKDSTALSASGLQFEEEKVRVFRNPLTHLLTEAMSSARLTAPLKLKLEKVFCSGDFSGKLLDNKFAGMEDSFLTHCIGIIAHDPTVDEEVFQEFLPWYYSKLIRAKGSKEELYDKYFTMPFERRWWTYDEEWSLKTQVAMDHKVQAGAKNIKLWADPDTGKYTFYDMNTGALHKMTKTFLLDRVKHALDLDLDTSELEMISDRFDPSVAEEFFTDSNGREVYNLFALPKWMSLFLNTAEHSTCIPYYTGKILENLFPEKEIREGFLHNLAHHLRYRQFSPTAWIITGAEGSGKNMFFGQVVASLYEKYFNTVAVTSLTGPYQDALLSKLFVLIDEAEDEKKTYQTTTLITALKRIVGNETISGRAIYKGTVEQKNHLFLVLVSNEAVPVQISGAKDRRFNVSNTGPNLQELDWYQAIPDINLPSLLQEELEEFVIYLASIKTSAAQTRKIYSNQARQNLVQDSIPFADKVAEALIQRNPDLLPVECDDELVALVSDLQEYNLAYVSVAQLKELLPFHSNKVSRLLAKKGIEVTQKSVQGKKTRVIMINPQGAFQKEETLRVGKPNMGDK